MSEEWYWSKGGVKSKHDFMILFCDVRAENHRFALQEAEDEDSVRSIKAALEYWLQKAAEYRAKKDEEERDEGPHRM